MLNYESLKTLAVTKIDRNLHYKWDSSADMLKKEKADWLFKNVWSKFRYVVINSGKSSLEMISWNIWAALSSLCRSLSVTMCWVSLDQNLSCTVSNIRFFTIAMVTCLPLSSKTAPNLIHCQILRQWDNSSSLQRNYLVS